MRWRILLSLLLLLPQIDIPGSVQHFERGLMIWFAPRPAPPAGSLPRTVIAISTPSLQVSMISDTWEAGKDPEHPAASPPDGRYVPARGFGKVWAAQPELREQLGWAIDPEPQASRVDYQHFSGGLFVRVYATNTVYALRDFRGPPPHAQLIAATP
jgi:hypothetical protein